MEAIPERYEKNPLLAVLEHYVIAALGKLPPEKDQLLNDVVCRNLGGTEWRKTIRQQFNLPAETDENLRQLWAQRQAEADLKQESLTLEQFAREVVDELFADLGG